MLTFGPVPVTKKTSTDIQVTSWWTSVTGNAVCANQGEHISHHEIAVLLSHSLYDDQLYHFYDGALKHTNLLNKVIYIIFERRNNSDKVLKCHLWQYIVKASAEHY